MNSSYLPGPTQWLNLRCGLAETPDRWSYGNESRALVGVPWQGFRPHFCRISPQSTSKKQARSSALNLLQLILRCAFFPSWNQLEYMIIVLD